MLLRLVLGLAAVSFAAGSVIAAPTSTWTVDQYTQWKNGEADAVFVSSAGEIRPGTSATEIAVPFPASWSLAIADNGDIYVGSDDAGKIFRIRGTKVSEYAQLKGELAVTALALASDGTLYAGTLGGNSIWSVRNGKASKLSSLKGVETVWALVLDKSEKNLYAGTGPSGKLFRITRAGKASIAASSEDKRILSMALADDGAVWFGTSQKAMVFRHDPKKGTTRAMADFDGNEITAMAFHAGYAIVAANNIKEPAAPMGARSKTTIDAALKKGGGVKGVPPKKGTKPGADKVSKAASKPPRKNARKGKGTLFRVRGDGQLKQLHALPATYFSAVSVGEDGQVYAGAASNGQVFVVNDKSNVSIAFDVSQRAISHIASNSGTTVFATADSAALYRSTGLASKSSYTSEAKDMKSPTRFGTIRWHGSKSVRIETRSGFTADPKVGWSKWQSPAKQSRGGGGTMVGRVVSPPGRYLQFRAVFPNDRKAVVRKLTVYYLPQNQATSIESVVVKTKKKSKELSTVKPSSAKPRSPVLKVEWKVKNPDKDVTTYRLHVRREGELRWRELAKDKAPLSKTSYEWNTETFPDGYYQLRVSSSDRRSNPNGRVVESHKHTGTFLVDNVKPKIASLSIRLPAVSTKVSDKMSAVAEMAYSVDDGPWRVGKALDGLFDSQSEVVTLSLEKTLASGVHTIVIRAADEAGNVASRTETFEVP